MATVKLFGADWCPDCHRAKGYLRDNGIHFQYVDVDFHDWATQKVESINKGKRIIPTILINGKPYSNPDNATLRDALQIETRKETKVYDTIIIGGGAAGLTTAIYAQRDRFETIILEKKTIGGNAFLTKKIENYPGFTNISGPALMEKMEFQARTYGAEIATGVDVEHIKMLDNKFVVTSKTGTYIGRSIVAATGSTYRRLHIPGEEELIGSGTHFCATCDGAFYRDRKVIIIGGGNSALEEGIFLSGFVRNIKLVHRSTKFSASPVYTEKIPRLKNIETLMNRTPMEFIADEKGLFQGLKLRDNESGKEEVIEADGAFIFVGLVPNTELFKDVVHLNKGGFITTKGLAKTSVEGIFAAGDCREGAIAQVAAATGEGVLASYGLREYLKN
jgi:thioredoxin reductase (NADPH)